ncbi:MAG: hypothetical protein LBU73_10400 [Helicobacteraceae bacterium]|jgi:chemotaxis protein methyltransferase CheR|nr:hypothetical protein [Helicobacteraceae bacterium]
MTIASLSELITARSGVVLDDVSRDRLVTEAAALFLDKDQEDADLSDLAPFFTTNETYFFREKAHFALLSRLIRDRYSKTRGEIRILSAASSIGCEAYSIAVLFEDFNSKSLTKIAYKIDAFDINKEAIYQAKSGKFNVRTLRDDGKDYTPLLEVFIKERGNDFFVLNEYIRSRVNFYEQNIFDGIKGRYYDLVFFRNALIYFTTEAKARALDLISGSLKEDGVLIVGVGESALEESEELAKIRDKNVFYFEKNSAKKEKVEIIENIVIKSIKKSREKREVKIEKEPQKVNVNSHIDPYMIASLIRSGETNNDRDINSCIAKAIDYIHDNPENAGNLITKAQSFGVSKYTLFLRAELLLETNDQEGAVKCYKEALKRSDNFWIANFRLGQILNSKNYLENSLKVLLEKGAMGLEVFVGGFATENYISAIENRLKKCLKGANNEKH